MNKTISREKLTLITVIVAALLLLGLAVCIGAVIFSNADQNTPQTTEPSVSVTEASATESTAPSTVAEEEETSEATEETEEEETPTFTLPAYSPTPTQPTTPAQPVLYLPYTIPGTSLVIQRIAPYSGIYLEDGSNETVADVAAILLYNGGTEAVEYASVTMVYDNGTLEFTASAIPAGAQVAVQESSRRGVVGGALRSCTADVALLPEMTMSADQIQIVDNGDNSLTITNLTDQDIATVRIFYKYYYQDQAAYVGGITFTAKISNLIAGGTLTITPSHYSSTGSMVVMIRTYHVDA